MKKAIIHIGAHKTGSSSLQKFLFEYHNWLETDVNIIYPVDISEPKYGFWGHNYLTWYFTRPTKMPISITQLQKIIGDFFEKILSQRDKNFTLLLSSEDFTWNTQIERFINILRDAGFEEIITIMYVRRQDESALSLYQTGIRDGLCEDFVKWFSKSKHIFNYYEIAERWKNVSDKIIVRPYNRKVLLENDIIKDFLNLLSLELGIEIQMPDDYESQKYHLNVALPDFATLILKHYNCIDNSNKVREYLIKVSDIFYKHLPELPKLNFVPPSLKKKILEEFKDSNKLLCEKYLGNEYYSYFESAKFFSTEDIEWQKRFGYSGSQLVELIKAVIQLTEKLSNQKEEKDESIRNH